MNIKVKDFIVKQNRTNVSILNDNTGDLDVKNTFTESEFKEFVQLLEDVSNKVWKELKIKEADSMGSDYFEYYDRKLDNNGYLNLKNNTEIGVNFERPMRGDSKVYQFNKQKMGAFLFDCQKIIKERG